MKKLLITLSIMIMIFIAVGQQITYSQEYNGDIVARDQNGNLIGTYSKDYSGNWVFEPSNDNNAASNPYETKERNYRQEYAPYVPQIPVGSMKEAGEYMQRLADDRHIKIQTRLTSIERLIDDVSSVDRKKYFELHNDLLTSIDKMNDADLTDNHTYRSILDYLDDMEESAISVLKNNK